MEGRDAQGIGVMTVANKWPKAAQEAMRALYSNEPTTDAHRAEHDRLVAREYARREARLSPSPQLELEAVSNG